MYSFSESVRGVPGYPSTILSGSAVSSPLRLLLQIMSYTVCATNECSFEAILFYVLYSETAFCALVHQDWPLFKLSAVRVVAGFLLASLPNSERSRVVLLPEHREHLVSPFDDAERKSFIDHSLHWPRMPRTAGPAKFRGREVSQEQSPTLIVWFSLEQQAGVGAGEGMKAWQASIHIACPCPSKRF